MRRLRCGGGGGYQKPRSEGCHEILGRLPPVSSLPTGQLLIFRSSTLSLLEWGTGGHGAGTPSPGSRDPPCSCLLETGARPRQGGPAGTVCGAQPLPPPPALRRHSWPESRGRVTPIRGLLPGGVSASLGSWGGLRAPAGSEKLDVGQGLGFRA